MKLVRHNVAYCNEQYFCYICRTVMSNAEDALNHINGKTHWQREFKEKFHSSLPTSTKRKKKVMQKISKYNAKIVTSYSYFCVVCQEDILNVISILQHIRDRRHQENLSSPKNDDWIVAISDMKIELKMKSGEIDIQPLVDAYENYESTSNDFYKCIYFELFKTLHDHSNDIFQTIVFNGIIIFESYNVKCPICNCLIDNFKLAVRHINEHKKQEALSAASFKDDALLLFDFEEERRTKLEEQNKKGNASEEADDKAKVIDFETFPEEEVIAKVPGTKKKEKKKFKCTFCNSSACFYECKKVFQQRLVENEIVVTNLGRFRCKLCKIRRIKHVAGIVAHMKSITHRQLRINKFQANLKRELVIDCPNVVMKINMKEESSLNGSTRNLNHNVAAPMVSMDEIASTVEADPNGEKNNEALNTNDSGSVASYNTKASNSSVGIADIIKGIDKISINVEDNSIESLLTKGIKEQITKFLNFPLRKRTPEENSKKPHLIDELNRPYTLKYLEIEEAMYNSQRKLNDFRIGLKFIVPYNAYTENLFCLVCNNLVSNEFAALYEHVSFEEHRMMVNEMTKDERSEKLLRQYIKETKGLNTETIRKCFACNVPNISNVDKHIKSNSHKMNQEKVVKMTDEIFTYASQSICDLWYNVQRFGCALCKERFNYKMNFLQHIVGKHSYVSLKDIEFDFCIPCTTLWLAVKNSYAEHCKGKVHKYLVKHKDFMIGSLPKNVEELLRHVDYVTESLLENTKTLLNDNIQDEIIKPLESSLRDDFPKVKAYLFGSRMAGLATVNSDVDIYIDCGNTYYQDSNESIRKDYLLRIKHILMSNEEWLIKEILVKTRIPLIKVVHKRTGLNCDISTINGLSVEKSKLLRCLNDSYPPCRKLILFVKKWFSYFDLPGTYGIISYALTWLVMFYLQKELYLPSVTSLLQEGKNEIKNSNKQPTIISGWEVDIAQPKNNNNNFNQSTSTLLIGFFKFYADFDYQHNVICPLMGHPVPREDFVTFSSLPEEMGTYIWQLKMSNTPKYLRIDSPLCIQDPFELTENMTKAVSSITLRYFKQYCHESALVLESLSK